jgi:alpha-tubulin suppressor-like RCC1 family protein
LLKVQIASVACGWQHTLALTSLGRVFSWGYGEDGQLGHGDPSDQLLPRELDFFKKQGLLKVAMISAGHSHSGCITETDPARLFMWGANSDFRLMTEDNQNRYLPSLTMMEKIKEEEQVEPCYLSLGVTHSAVITRKGELYTAGSK